MSMICDLHSFSNDLYGIGLKPGDVSFGSQGVVRDVDDSEAQVLGIGPGVLTGLKEDGGLGRGDVKERQKHFDGKRMLIRDGNGR